jgi:predicted dehydrogenase
MAGERVIVVGAGSISKAWFPVLAAEKVRVAAVVDLKLAAAKRRLSDFGLTPPLYKDLKRALKEERADFVLDLTVPEAHCEVTCTALKAGLPVLGEKPMAVNMTQARRMVRTSEKTGQLYVVSQSRRWSTPHETIRKTIATGRLGRLSQANCDFFIGAHFGGFRDKMASPLVLDMAIHQFDLARMMTGADPERVYASEFNPKGSWYQGDAAANCLFEMTSGVPFLFSGSWCAEGCRTSWNGDWRLIGEKGTLLYADDQPPRGEVVANKMGFMRKVKKLAIAKARVKHESFRGALREMLDYLRHGNVPQTECHDNIKSLAMVFAAIESSQKGRAVKVRGL